MGGGVLEFREKDSVTCSKCGCNVFYFSHQVINAGELEDFWLSVKCAKCEHPSELYYGSPTSCYEEVEECVDTRNL